MEIIEFLPNIFDIVGHQAITLSQMLTKIGQLHNNVLASICGNTQTLNLGVVPWQPMLNEVNNKIETPMSTLWLKRKHKIKVEKLLHHEIHSGIEAVLE